MRWDPCAGHVPRGFCGATGGINEVQLVLVNAEPGNPREGESYLTDSISSAIARSTSSLRNPIKPFHRNTRLIMELCFPGIPLDEQLRRTWRTNAVLCSAKIKCGPVPREIEDTCVQTYLLKQLELFPQEAIVAALGVKAQKRLDRYGIKAVAAPHPTCRQSTAAKMKSWQALADRVHERFPPRPR
jgi:hypothetical protein